MVSLNAIQGFLVRNVEPWQIFMVFLIVIPMFYYNMTLDQLLAFFAEIISGVIIWYSERIIYNARHGLQVLIPGLLKATEDGLEKVTYPNVDIIKIPKFPKIKI